MRVAVIVVSMLVVATPSEASKSCMSKTEARQHFGSVHIYWHGPDHCWDATATRRHQIHKVQRKNDQSKWHNALSEMLADDEPVRTLGVQTSQQHRNDPAVAGAPWVDRWVDIEPSQPLGARWVDIVQVAPPPIADRKPEPMVRPRDAVLVLIAIILMLAIIEVLFRRMIYERPKSTTNF
jgi:hypothetical protein